MQPLNLFYEEPDPDRWFKYDHYLRRFIRRLVRGKARPGGQMMVALELMRGLDKLNIPYRFNDYTYAAKHPDELIGVIGKTFLLSEKKFKNPILFGASVFSHPLEAPDLLKEHPNIKKILVPGEWMKKMFEPYYGNLIESWPVGIDTGKWNPAIKQQPVYDFLIYDKIRWNHNEVEEKLIRPVRHTLEGKQLSYTSIVYGQYTHDELLDKVGKSKAVIFLCEHETQGLAYQQILATNTPVLAYDLQEYWVDPAFYPHRVKFGPVSSVPYWDERCGMKFNSAIAFDEVLDQFMSNLNQGNFSPRAYILENLSLESCAMAYQQLYSNLSLQLNAK